MSRYSAQKSYDHDIRKMGDDWYRIGWCIDRYSAGSRLRTPTYFDRDTDESGARRFAKKHDIEMPEDELAASAQ